MHFGPSKNFDYPDYVTQFEHNGPSLGPCAKVSDALPNGDPSGKRIRPYHPRMLILSKPRGL